MNNYLKIWTIVLDSSKNTCSIEVPTGMNELEGMLVLDDILEQYFEGNDES